MTRRRLAVAVGVGAALVGIGAGGWAVWRGWGADDGPRPGVPVATASPAGGATLTPLAIHVPPDTGPPMRMVLPDAGVHVAAVAAVDHPCRGEWRGQLRQSDGMRGTGTVIVDDAGAAQCGTLTERWTTGQVCRYRFARCAAEAERIVGRGTSAACPPIRVTMTCRGDRMTFLEDDLTVTVSATLQRLQRSP